MIIHNIISEAIKTGIGLGSSEQCYMMMYSIARAFQIKKMVEIGTYKGYSTIAFCQAILDNKYIPEIYAVDLWNNYGKDISVDKIVAEKNFKISEYNKYITIIHGDSKIELPKLFNKIGKVDLCFIDGDHTYEMVLKDYNNCKNYSNVLLFHDTGKEGDVKYLDKVREEGWIVSTFPTQYIEGNGHLVGISLAYKKGI